MLAQGDINIIQTLPIGACGCSGKSSYSRAGVGGDVSWAAKDPLHQGLRAHAGA